MNLMRFRNYYFLISLLVILPGLYSLVRYGLRPSIDFTGGSLLELKVSNSPAAFDRQLVQELVGDSLEINSIQQSGADQYIIRGKQISNAQKNDALLKLQASFPEIREERFETVGPILGRELLIKTLTAAALVALLITLYVARQFSELKYGICAILAMIHDSLVLLGVFSLFGYYWGVEVDVLFITALMTTLSFSVHDTIVVYDRIREVRRKNMRISFFQVVDLAVLQTLGRSINNSMTIIIMLLSLVLLGGESIKWFGVALLIGAVTGTYSSTFVAAPLLLLWEQLKKKRA